MGKWIWVYLSVCLSVMILALTPNRSLADESTVYQVYRPIDLGLLPEPPPKDIYVNITGHTDVKKGAKLDIYRRVASFDTLTQKHVGDHLIPVAKIRVIYVDEKTAIGRIDQFVSLAQEPALYPQAVMVGDVARIP